MSKNYWILTLILIGGSISLLATLFLLPKKTTQVSNTTKNQNTTAPTPAEILPPISIDAPIVISANINYLLNGKITEIKTIPQGFELVTDITTPNIPQFIVCITCSQQTQIYGNFINGQRQVNYNMLTTGQNVRINVSYNLKTKEWTTNRVNIQDRLTLPTSPPRTQQGTSSAR